MNDSERFERLCARLLASPSLHRQSFSHFADLCRQEGLSLTVADNLFFSRFGLSAESFLLLF
jgi:hypothetical protein